MQSIEYGVWHDFRQMPPFTLDYGRFYGECLDEIVAAEEWGYSHVWLSEHHEVEDGYLPAPLVAAGVIAGRTQRIQIGTNVILLPLYHPLRVAEDVVVLDLASGGRFILGIGGGYVQFEFETYGVNRRYRPSMLEEGVAILRQAWDEGRVDFQGKRWQFAPRPFTPQPQRRIPIYFGANSPVAIERGARLGDGFLATAPRGFDSTIESYANFRKGLEAVGRSPDAVPFVVSAWVYVHEDGHKAWSDVAPGIAYQQGRYADWGTDRELPRPQPLTASTLPRDAYPLVGNPEQVADKLLELYRRVPFHQLCFWGRLPGLSHAQALESTRLFMQSAVPLFHQKLRQSSPVGVA